MDKPIRRSRLRARAGMAYYGLRRRLLWRRMSSRFASDMAAPLEYVHFSHSTPLLRKLRDVDMQYQYNKIINLKIAVRKISGVVIHPGEVFSYWKLIGKPSKRKGYVAGMVLHGGAYSYGTGGGLCQLSNMLFWMALHSPLTVVERHRHGYDVFPDSNRTQPFGSGATCFYPHGDLMLRNDTNEDFQFVVAVGERELEGELRSTAPAAVKYEIVEKNHRMEGEYWGGYSRHNELYRRTYDLTGELSSEEFLLKNDALMMYSPFIEAKGAQHGV